MNIKEILIGALIFLIFFFSAYLVTTNLPEGLECNSKKIENKDICLLKLAKQKEDTSFCKGIKDHGLFDMCNQKIWLRNDCIYWSIIGEGKDDCILDRLGKDSLTKCYEVQNTIKSKECVDFYYAEASEKNDHSFCSNHPSCILYAILQNNNSENCKLLKEIDSPSYKLCNTFFKINKPTLPLCQEDDCFIFDYSKKAEICNAPNKQHISFCNALKSIDRKDPTFCLSENPNKNSTQAMVEYLCLISLGTKYSEEEYCNLINFECNAHEDCLIYLEDMKNLCFYSVTKDTRFCENNPFCFDWCTNFKEFTPLFDICTNLISDPTFKSLEYTSALKNILFDFFGG